jgi:hypothetical protein
MLRTKNFGRKSLNEIKDILSEMGLEGLVLQSTYLLKLLLKDFAIVKVVTKHETLST